MRRESITTDHPLVGDEHERKAGRHMTWFAESTRLPPRWPAINRLNRSKESRVITPQLRNLVTPVAFPCAMRLGNPLQTISIFRLGWASPGNSVEVQTFSSWPVWRADHDVHQLWRASTIWFSSSLHRVRSLATDQVQTKLVSMQRCCLYRLGKIPRNLLLSRRKYHEHRNAACKLVTSDFSVHPH